MTTVQPSITKWARETRELESLEVEYVHDKTNPGIALAYNKGLRRARELNRQFILIFDQDSCVEKHYLRKTFESVRNYPNHELYLPIVEFNGKTISPTRLCLGRETGFKGLICGVNQLHNFFAINRGMLINVNYLESIGGYDERFNLYGSDFWFCKGYSAKKKPFVITGAIIRHDLAQDTCKDVERRLWIYTQYVRGGRILYAYNPLTLFVLSVLGFAGAVKRSWCYWDIRYIKVFLIKNGKKSPESK